MKSNNFGRILILSRREIETHLSLTKLIEDIKNAYALHATQRDLSPQRAVAVIDDGSIVINFPGGLAGFKTYTVKTNTKMPSNHGIGLPFVVGAILLLDRATGLPLAVMESSLITAMRTCAAGAIGVAALARPQARWLF
jgi:ornithine cyclodeaminase/alanine dehydrogenase-like protein (mu-crystallin family)